MDIISNTTVIAFCIGYFFGSIPFGLLLARLAGAGDIRNIGSGNIGATNVLRTGNKGLALMTLLLDGGKGAIALILVSSYIEGTPHDPLIAGFAAFLGHLYPAWLKFKGGKGVATYLGVLFAASGATALATSGTWLLAAIIWRMSSFAALVASALAPIYGYYFGGFNLMLLCLGMSVLVFQRHHENIKRILAGDEPKIGAKK